jgi:TRAP-type transport system periplasmic protein
MRNMKLLVSVLIGLLLISTIILSACSTPAAPATTSAAPTTTAAPAPIKLRFGSGFPETHTHSVAQLAYLQKIESDSKGRVVFEKFFGGTLVSSAESSTQVANGIADIGMSSAPYSAYYKIGNDLNAFFLKSPDWVVSTKVYEELRAKFPEIDKELAISKLVAWAITPFNQTQTTKKAVRTLEDFKSMQLRCAGNTVDGIAALGAVPIAMAPGEVFISLQKGTIDGAVGSFTYITDMKLGDVVKYVTVTNFGSAPFPSIEINNKVWDSMPADVQKVFLDNKDYLNEQYRRVFGGEVDKSKAVMKDKGIEEITLSAAERAKINQVLDELSKKKAAAMDAKGLAGTQMLTEVNKLFEKYSK